MKGESFVVDYQSLAFFFGPRAIGDEWVIGSAKARSRLPSRADARAEAGSQCIPSLWGACEG